MRKTVYIASPYSVGNIEQNVKRSLDAANILLKYGFIPFCPLLYHYWHLHTPKTYEEWMQLDLQWLSKCDMVLRLHGESSGADREVEYARELGIPVMYIFTTGINYV